MKATLSIILCVLIFALPAAAQPVSGRDASERHRPKLSKPEPAPQKTEKAEAEKPAPVAEKKSELPKSEKNKKPKKMIAPPKPKKLDGMECQWLGHSFIYLTSKNGIRIAIDPFREEIKLPFPKQLHADVVLISYESADRSGGERLFGAPQIFRGVTGIGANRASGILFRGIETFRDASRGRDLGRNTVYVFNLDGMRFCHLGGIGYPLSSRNREDIGQVDVLFLPIGNKILENSELLSMALKLEAKWIVPIAYYNKKAGFTDLRSLAEFLEECKVKAKIDAKKVDGDTFIFRPKEIPDQPTLLLFKEP